MFITADSIRLALSAFALLLAAKAAAFAQPQSGARRVGATARQQNLIVPFPNFGSYPAYDLYGGRPAPIRARTRRDRQFRTRLREGAAAGPNFAGHYTVVFWGCGTGCAQLAVVDAKTGLVYWPPLDYVDIPTPDGEQYGALYQYGPGHRIDSRLLVLNCSHHDREQSYTSYFYVFDRGRFRLVRTAQRRARPAGAEDAAPPNDDPHGNF
jgi:hypothetical protein